MSDVEKNFELDKHEGRAYISMRGTVCMYAGDRGTEVCPQQRLTRQELKALIVRLVKLWRGMDGAV